MKQKIENDNSIYVAKTKFDDVFCERAIGLYEMREKHAKAEIIQSTNAFHDGTHQDTISRKDRATYIDDYDTHRDLGDLDLTNAINLALTSSMAEYIELFPTLKACSIRSTRQKIQKTLPKEGYHVWHFENGSLDTSDRVLAWTIYLNDVEELNSYIRVKGLRQRKATSVFSQQTSYILIEAIHHCLVRSIL